MKISSCYYNKKSLRELVEAFAIASMGFFPGLGETLFFQRCYNWTEFCASLQLHYASGGLIYWAQIRRFWLAFSRMLKANAQRLEVFCCAILYSIAFMDGLPSEWNAHAFSQNNLKLLAKLFLLFGIFSVEDLFDKFLSRGLSGRSMSCYLPYSLSLLLHSLRLEHQRRFEMLLLSDNAGKSCGSAHSIVERFVMYEPHSLSID